MSIDQHKNNSKEEFLTEYTPEEKFNFSNFEILKDKQIGQGAFSNVYISKNKIDNKNYACKLIPQKTVHENGVGLDVIYNEISIHEKIIHPNIVRMYNHYEDKENIYCFLEYVEGQTLYSKIKNNPNGLTERETYKIFSQIINAIKFLHKNNIIHRDIKLENFLIKKDEKSNKEIIKLCDFGWSVQLTEEMPKRLTTCGTFEYMSPELINEEAYDYSIDIWALGVLLYELLHGKTPFSSANHSNENDFEEIFKNVMKNNIKIKDSVSNNCKKLILKFLKKNPEERININDVENDNWFKEYNEDDNENLENNNNNFNSNGNLNEIDDNEFFNVLNLVEEKNQSKKKGKRKKNENAKNKKNVAYKKNEDKKNSISKIDKSSLSNLNQDNSNLNKKENNENKSNNNISDNLIEEKKDKKNIINNNNKNKMKIVEEISPRDIKKIEENVNDYSAQNLLNMLDNKKNYNNNNNNNKKSFLEEDIEEINTNTSNLQRKKEEMQFRANAPKAQISNISNGNYQRRINNMTNKINIGNISSENDLQMTLEMFAKAEQLKQQNDEIKKPKKEESFWDKIFKPFKCGDN
jgi:serine/threonine protein kinase